MLLFFPGLKLGDCPYDFSFSGVKSAVLNYLNQAQMKGEEVNQCRSGRVFSESSRRCACRTYHAGC